MSQTVNLTSVPISEQYMVLDAHRCVYDRSHLRIIQQDKQYFCKECQTTFINNLPSNVGYEEEWAGSPDVIGNGPDTQSSIG